MTEVQRKSRAKHRNHIRAYSRKWKTDNREHVRAYNNEWNANHSERAVSRVRAWKMANPEKKKAHRAIQNRVRRGRIIREPCVECGNPKSHGHHEDYSKPFDIIWLCALHHNRKHHLVA